MAAKQHGTAYMWGVDTTNPTSAQVVSARNSQGLEIDDVVLNSSGEIVSRRLDDIKQTLSLVLRIESGYTRPTLGNKITLTTGAFAGDWLVVGTDEGKEVKGFVEFTITAEKLEYLTLT